ncbi:hypothetical protein PAEPH01_0557 [Pancytospora epiphaga]|nr:hypothetical protein PAEPH01_0557 [Pancytospora epiphaga]
MYCHTVMNKLYHCLILLFLIEHLASKSKEKEGVYFKTVDGEQFIGHDSGDKELKLVNFDHAVRFKLGDIEHQGEKRLETIDGKDAFTEKGPWYWPGYKWFVMDEKGAEAKQGFNIVYSAPDVWVLMRDNYCLSATSGKFRKEYCTDKNIPKFRMCKNKKCKNKGDKLAKDIKFIKCALAMTVMPDRKLSASEMSSRPLSHGDLMRLLSPQDNKMMQPLYDDTFHEEDYDDRLKHSRRSRYRPRRYHGESRRPGPRRVGRSPHRYSQESQDTSSSLFDEDSNEWSSGAFNSFLDTYFSKGSRGHGKKYTGRRVCKDDSRSDDDSSSDYTSGDCIS